MGKVEMLNNYYRRDDRREAIAVPGAANDEGLNHGLWPAVRASKSIEGAVAFREQAGTGCVVGGL